MFIKPGLRDEYLAALHEFLVLARQEPGCIFIFLYASEAADERGTIVVFERFRDPDAFNELLQRHYAQRYLKLAEAAFAAPRIVPGFHYILARGRHAGARRCEGTRLRRL